MKEKIKPMLIGGGIGAAAGLGTAFLMGKKETKNLVLFGAIGLAAGAVVCFFLCGKKEEQKSNAEGTLTKTAENTVRHWNKKWYSEADGEESSNLVDAGGGLAYSGKHKKTSTR